MHVISLLVCDMHVVLKVVMWCCITRFWDDYSPSARWMCLIEMRTGVLSVLKERFSVCMVLPSGVAKQ